MSRIAWLSPIIERYPTLERVVVLNDPLAPTIWISAAHGWQSLADPPIVAAVMEAVKQSLSDDDEALFTSTGLITHTDAIDGVGQVVLRHIRGPVPTTTAAIIPFALEGGIERWGIDERLMDSIASRARGLVLVGGMSQIASQLSRALFTEVTARAPESPAAVIGPRPVARAIARTPWLWIACDPRSGITRVEDAADAVVGMADIALLDVGGGAGAVEAAIRMIDAGALVIAQFPGDGVHAILERWEAAIANAERETWSATVAALKAVISVERIAGRFGFELLTEWLPIDTAGRTTLAREGPSGAAVLLNSPGARSREAALTALRARGAVVA